MPEYNIYIGDRSAFAVIPLPAPDVLEVSSFSS